uniref:Uncharacterized protein n=1 Tax=Glossina palpalis gambiensis TaxID=67801 RepID=A0A1B0BJ10_9MUSC
MEKCKRNYKIRILYVTSKIVRKHICVQVHLNCLADAANMVNDVLYYQHGKEFAFEDFLVVKQR